MKSLLKKGKCLGDSAVLAGSRKALVGTGWVFFLLSCTKRHRKCSFHLVDMANSRHSTCCDTGISDAGGVWFALNGTTYQNNSLVTMEDIGEWDGMMPCFV